MATDVVMPQMGESIAEGTITKWLVKVGDKVERDQPLFEISNSGWSRSTLSPTLTSHLVIVPSAIDSPIWGITTSVAMALRLPLVASTGCRRAEAPPLARWRSQ